MIADLTPLVSSVPEAFVIYFRWSILVTSVAALILTAGFTWSYRRFVRGYGLLILTGVVCYQLSELYRSAWALSLTPGLPLSWAGAFSLAANAIFILVCLEPARRKRQRINEGNERTDGLLDKR